MSWLAVASMTYADEFSFTVNDSQMDMGYLTKWVYFEDSPELCLIDTGARKSVVRTLFGDRTPVGKEPSGGLGGIGEMSELIKVTEIKLDSWISADLVIRRTESIPMNCIIGNDVFMKRNFLLDHERKVFTTDFQASEKNHPLKIYNNQWFGFPVQIGTKAIVDSLFDTGAAATLLDPKLIEDDPENFEFIQEIEITDGSNKKLKSAIYKMKVLSIQGLDFQDVIVLSYPLDVLQNEMPTVRVILGYNVIRRHNWWFNFDLKRWGN